MGRNSNNPNRLYRAYEAKPETGQHIERAPSREPHDDTWMVDETLIKAEGEDKVTPYLLMVIMAVCESSQYALTIGCHSWFLVWIRYRSHR